jgi:AraC-like DNA-binding protein/quercetin dioxygenase-like cupin family protein
MLYQTQHSITTDKVTLEAGNNLNFPDHIHNSFEIIIATEGEMTVTVLGNEYTISGNECVLVFPYQLHEIKTQSHAKHTILIFSPQLVRAFSKKIENQMPKSNKFVLNEFYIDKITTLNKEEDSILLKGLLYSICAEFDKTAKYIESKDNKQDLLLKIFNFVSKNYKTNCSLYELSKGTSYNYVYLSKHFSKRTGISYTEYVCRFRINEACYLLLNTSSTMVDIAYECGFECLRSFNRSFKSIIGISPSEYRKQKNEKSY